MNKPSTVLSKDKSETQPFKAEKPLYNETDDKSRKPIISSPRRNEVSDVSKEGVNIYQSKETIVKYQDVEGKVITAYNYVNAGLRLDYITKVSINKTVIVLGESRAGKSQLIKNMIHPGSIAIKTGVAETAVSYNSTFTIEFEGVVMTVDFIDTPGFKEKKFDSTARSNEEIEKRILDKLKDLTTKVDVILLVTRQLADSDITALTTAYDLFGSEAAENTYLVITGCEGCDSDKENQLANDILTNEKLENLKTIINRDKILFSGCIPDTMAKNEDNLKFYTKQQIERNMKIIRVIKNSKPKTFSKFGNTKIRNTMNIDGVIETIVNLQKSIISKRDKMLIDVRSVLQDSRHHFRWNKEKKEYNLKEGLICEEADKKEFDELTNKLESIKEKKFEDDKLDFESYKNIKDDIEIESRKLNKLLLDLTKMVRFIDFETEQLIVIKSKIKLLNSRIRGNEEEETIDEGFIKREKK